MDKTMEIKEIKLQLGKKEISLSVEEAKKLKELLSELFGKEVVKEHHYHGWYWNYPVYNQPFYYYQGALGLNTCSAGNVYLSQTSSISANYTANSGTLNLAVS